MSRRRKASGPFESQLASNGSLEGQIRVSQGHSRSAYPKPKYKTTRRLKCDACKKTWKFSDSLNFSVCPSCKQGRLS